MPKVKANNITINYDQQGSGEPLILIPYLAADHMCYAFQVPEYGKHFTCITPDLRGTGESDKPESAYSTEVLADDIAALMRALGIAKAHISGLSLGGAVGLWLAAKHPEMVTSLSLHGAWPKTDPSLKAVVQGWQAIARAMGNVAEMVIAAMFPWCYTPELYNSKPEYIQMLSDFMRGRPVQPVESFVLQSNAVIGHDAEAQLGRITAPTQITVGASDILTLRFADLMKAKIRDSELVIFAGCAHATIYEKPEEFNAKTLDFLLQHKGIEAAPSSKSA
jgi:pimeloyl-ACP methyl ester carboxylesterase